MKGVTESRSDDLRERSAQRARSFRHAARVDSVSRLIGVFRLIGRGEMTQLVNHSTLLRHQQQQQQTQCFEHVSHSAQRLGNQVCGVKS
jgi:hypothetical protein